ncbi:MAG: carbohydrate kinase [Eubacteriales bacterium]
MYDLVALGEILIDFSPDGADERGYAKYIQNPGGAVANVAAVLARYGAKAALVGKVGEDLFGEYLHRYFGELGVDCRGMISDPEYNTTLAFVSLKEDGERDFAFYRRHEADLRLQPDEVPYEMLKQTKIFHFGSLSLTAEPARSATYAALDAARSAGALISYDPNYRASLWAGQDAPAYMKSVLDRVDFIKVSLEEGEMLTGCREPDRCAAALLDRGIRFAAVTMGADGAYYACPTCRSFVEPYRGVHTIDTTGAGDVFWGTMLYEYLRHSFDTPQRIQQAADRAAHAAALCTGRKGGASSIPDYGEI